MSQQSVEIVRRAYLEGYAVRSVEAAQDMFAGDFRFHMRPGWPGRPVYRLEEMTQLWADLDETYTEYELTPEDLAAIGDYVIVTLRQSARMRGSDARIEATIWHVWHIPDATVREAWAFDNEAEARDAARQHGRRT